MNTIQPFPELGQFLVDQGLTRSAHINVEPLSGGQSNPTFRIDCADKQFVLRKQPQGTLLKSAHAIDREFRVITALHNSDVPVPRTYEYVHDNSITGTPFYLMDYVEGRILMAPSLPGMLAGERRAIYTEMNRVIAALHSVDVSAVGLDDFGRPGNYFARQIKRWSMQCKAATLPVSATMQRLMEWLPQNIPSVEETTLVHGDFRMDNLIFHPTQPRVIAVIDWELSTLGHPLADFSYHCMSWHVPPSLWRGTAGLNLAYLEIHSEAEYIDLYESATGREVKEHWDFYMAYNFFRMAAIFHGIAQRSLDGNSASTDAVETGKKAEPFAELAWHFAHRYATNFCQ